MKKNFLLLLLTGLIAQSSVMAQKPSSKFVQVTTIESVVGGGIGRSRMLITKDDGNTEEKDLDNLFSIAGINFKNIKGNEVTIIKTLKSFTDDGYKVFSTTPLTLSPGTSGSGIFMTRYLLIKEDDASKATASSKN